MTTELCLIPTHILMVFIGSIRDASYENQQPSFHKETLPTSSEANFFAEEKEKNHHFYVDKSDLSLIQPDIALYS